MKCGECHICKKEHYSEIGGWIINAEKKLFCETHTEGKESCFDEYIKRKTIPFDEFRFMMPLKGGKLLIMDGLNGVTVTNVKTQTIVDILYDKSYEGENNVE